VNAGAPERPVGGLGAEFGEPWTTSLGGTLAVDPAAYATQGRESIYTFCFHEPGTGT